MLQLQKAVCVQEPEAAAASLPPEPAAGDADGCSIAVRFPDGQRRQRRFPRQALISAVAAFCRVSSPEAAAGRPFVLTEPFPGKPLLCAVPKPALQRFMRPANKRGAVCHGRNMLDLRV